MGINMSPEKLLREALCEYLDKEGTSRTGAYRDIIVDLLHIASKDEELKKSIRTLINRKPDLHYLLEIGWEGYLEECKEAELDEAFNTERKKLPLLINKEWHYKEAKDIYKKRLESGPL